MAEGTYAFFNFIIMIQLFYGVGFTMLSYALIPYSPDSYLIELYEVPGNQSDEIIDDIQGSISNQINIPLIDLGALVFYSGNLIIDLMINFFTAIPSMVTLLIDGFAFFFSMDAYILTQFKLFAYSLITVLYLLNIMGWLTNVRSRGSVV